MTAQTQFSPAQEERFADLCAWCANGVEFHRNEQGDYVHFPDGRQECLASRLRKSLEKNPLDRMRECFDAESCPIEENPKRPRQDWFCVGCWRSLPKDIRNALQYRPGRSIAQWLQAMAMLKKRTETTGTHGR